MLLIALLERTHNVEISLVCYPKMRQTNIFQTRISFPNQVIMGSLRNRNKKKRFKQSMTNPIPQKIVFTTTTTTESGSQQPPSSSTSRWGWTFFHIIHLQSNPRLIPPSEIQELWSTTSQYVHYQYRCRKQDAEWRFALSKKERQEEESLEWRGMLLPCYYGMIHRKWRRV